MIPENFTNSSIFNDAEKIESYWKNLQPNLDLNTTSKEKWKPAETFLEQISMQNSVFVLIWNAVVNQFVYATDKRNVFGYPADLYLGDNGVEFSLSTFHPDTFDANLIMQQKAFEVLLQAKDKLKVITSMDGLLKTGNDSYIHFLQQAVCIELDDAGNSILFLSYCHDVTHLKKNKTANLIITQPGEIKIWNFNFETKELDTVQSLSKQEKIVLNFLSKGKSSKEIAEKLFISSLTVDQHRRNLLKKTNCIDTTAMITYSKIVGLI